MISGALAWYKKSKKSLRSLTHAYKKGKKPTMSENISRNDKNQLVEVAHWQSGLIMTTDTVIKEHSAQTKEAEAIDPITLEAIDKSRVTLLNGHRYDLVTLVRYYAQTQDFRDPLSMSALTEDQIIQLDMVSFIYLMHLNDRKEAIRREASGPMSAIAATDYAGTHDIIDIELPPLLPLFRKQQLGEISIKKMERSSILTLESICGGIISEIYDLMEADRKTEDREFTFLVFRLISEMDYAWRELKQMDSQAAYLAFQSYKAFLSGSVRKPTPDPHNRLQMVLSTLENALWTDADNSKYTQDRRDRSQSYTTSATTANRTGSPRIRAASIP